MKNLWMLLALSLFSGHALADGTMGNGSGWCQPTSGTHNFFFPLDQTITDTDENQAGKIVKESWSVGGEYSARCDCDNKDYQGVNYFTATTGDFDAPRDKCAPFREINGIAAAFQYSQKNYNPTASSFL